MLNYASVDVAYTYTILPATELTDNALSNTDTDNGREYAIRQKQEHIISVVQRCKKNKVLMEEIDETLRKNCGICLDVFELQQELLYLPCMHVFHNECILKYIVDNTTCPLCRQDILTTLQCPNNNEDNDENDQENKKYDTKSLKF